MRAHLNCRNWTAEKITPQLVGRCLENTSAPETPATLALPLSRLVRLRLRADSRWWYPWHTLLEFVQDLQVVGSVERGARELQLTFNAPAARVSSLRRPAEDVGILWRCYRLHGAINSPCDRRYQGATQKGGNGDFTLLRTQFSPIPSATDGSSSCPLNPCLGGRNYCCFKILPSRMLTFRPRDAIFEKASIKYSAPGKLAPNELSTRDHLRRINFTMNETIVNSKQQ